MASQSDWQRRKVYESEWAVQRGPVLDTWGKRIDSNSDYVGTLVADVFSILRDRGAYVPNSWMRGINPRYNYRRAHAERFAGRIVLGSSTTPWVVIHEACHLATDDSVPGHGVEFAENLLMVFDVLDSKVAATLRDEFAKRNVAANYATRAKYTRKRAVWIANKDPYGVEITMQRQYDGQKQMRINNFGYNTRSKRAVTLCDSGLVLPERAMAIGDPAVKADLTVPFDSIAYITPHGLD